MEIIWGIFKDRYFPSDSDLSEIEEALWKLIKYCTKLNDVVLNKFSYEIPEFTLEDVVQVEILSS